jgi:putative membrane protein
MKNWFVPAAIAGMFVVACNNGSTDSVKSAEKANQANADTMAKNQSVTDSSTAIPSRQDADFLVKAAGGGMLEVALGRLAQRNASAQSVKDFGEMMVRDHTRGGEDLKILARHKQVVLPDTISNEQKKEQADLAKKTGADFDRAYIKLMIKDHKEDIREFQKAAKNANDTAVKIYASTALPMLQRHLDAVERLGVK